MGIVPQTIPTPKWGIFLITLVNSRAQRQKTTLTWWHELQKKIATTLTWWQELQKKFVSTLAWWQQLRKRFPTALLLLRQANKRRRAPHVSHNFAVRIPLRHLRQTRFCWPFNNWQRTTIQSISITILAESRNCLDPSQLQCPHLMENQRNSNYLKIYSKQVWKSTICWLKKTK